MNLQVFIQLLGTLVGKYYPDSIKPIDSAGCLECRNITFDFIIVGAGSAGCVLANRLTETKSWNVLLIEAGGDEDYASDTPALHLRMRRNKFDWNYTTVAQKHACQYNNYKCFYPRGHAMGGSSTINAMIYDRGVPQDYDEWAKKSEDSSWNYRNIQQYFLKSEHMLVSKLAKSVYHSTKGPLYVDNGVYITPIINDILEAGVEYGLKVVDYNSIESIGVNYVQSTKKGPNRCSASKAYLNPIRNRTNLYIFKNTFVKKIIINEKTKTAEGVICVTKGVEYTVHASKEVIISAGSINTPQLLMLSGIGPADHLAQHNIPLLVDSPVGKNLVDHMVITLNFKINKSLVADYCCKEYTYESAVEYAVNRNGPLSTTGCDILAKINRFNNSATYPAEIELYMGMGNYTVDYRDNSPYLTVFVGVINVKSVGRVTLASNNYRTPPLIDPNYFADPSDLDLAVWGVRQALNYISTSKLAKYSPKWYNRFAQPCNNLVSGTDEHLRCYIRFVSATFYHPIGTARMGPAGKNTVVDSSLKVHGINRLSVVDASIMPRITRGTTNAPTIMIAEKGADIIKCRHKKTKNFEN